jgi:hypothetical protein
MYLVGDSIALSYAPAFKAIAETSNGQWRITTIGLYGCRFTDVDIVNEGTGVMESCPGRKADIAALIAADSPELVVVANAFTLGHTATGTNLDVTALVDSTVRETAKYNAAGRLVFLAPPPLGADLGQCYSPVSSPQACVTTVSDEWSRFAAATSATAAASGDVFIDSLPYSCANGQCPAFAGGIPTRYDRVHFTPAYAEHIAPVLRRALPGLLTP